MLFFYLQMIDTDEGKNKFEMVYTKYKDLLYYIAHTILKDVQLSEDAVQDAFFALAKNMKNFQSQSCNQIRNYLIIIVRNAAYRIYNQNKQEVPTDNMDSISEGDSSDYTVITSTGVPNIKLEEKLKEDSLVDTDKDGLDDWNEVDTDLIFKCFANRDTTATSHRNRSIATGQLPTYDEIKDYMKEKYGDSLNLSEETLQKLTVGEAEDNQIRILPIHSNPVDADSDNDGVIDPYDSKPLEVGEIIIQWETIDDYPAGNGTTYSRSGYRWTNEHLKDEKNKKFVTLKVYDRYINISNNAEKDVYYLPFNNDPAAYKINDSYDMISVIQSESEFWFKISDRERRILMKMVQKIITAI